MRIDTQTHIKNTRQRKNNHLCYLIFKKWWSCQYFNVKLRKSHSPNQNITREQIILNLNVLPYEFSFVEIGKELSVGLSRVS